MTAPTVDLVVARYQEDLQWLRRVPRRVRVWVYNKGPEIEVPRPQAERASLANVGREAHTYLHHITARYDAWADLTVFVQGKPFDHVPDLHRVLRGWAEGTEPAEAFRWLGFLIDRDDADGVRLFQKWSKNLEGRPLPMRAFWPQVFGATPCPDAFVFCGGANWMARADVLRGRPRAFYEQALQVAADFPDAAHCFERCWDRVLGVEGIPAAYRDRPMPVYLKPIRRLLDADEPAG